MNFLNSLFINDIVNIVNDYKRDVSDEEISKFEKKIKTFVNRFIKKNDNQPREYLVNNKTIYKRELHADDEFILFFIWGARRTKLHFLVNKGTGNMIMWRKTPPHFELEKKEAKWLDSSKYNININNKRHKKILYEFIKKNIYIIDKK